MLVARKRRWLWAGRGLVAAGLVLTSSGCMSFLSPAPRLRPEQLPCPNAISVAARSKVHVFLVNGYDPLRYGNLAGVCEVMQHQWGFGQTRYGEMYHAGEFGRDIRRIREEDAAAKVAVLGFSGGAATVQKLAKELCDEGVGIDLLVYCDPYFLSPPDGSHGSRVGKCLNFLAGYRVGGPVLVEGAETLQLPTLNHFSTPTDPILLERLASELGALAAAVPVPESAFVAFKPADEPVPRPGVPLHVPPVDPKWDFLSPRPRLLSPEEIFAGPLEALPPGPAAKNLAGPLVP